MSVSNLIVNNLSTLAHTSFQRYDGEKDTYITFFNISETIEQYIDDEEHVHGVITQVDVWSKSDYSKLVKDVRKHMKLAGFRFMSGRDLFEKETKTYHKILEFYYYGGMDNG